MTCLSNGGLNQNFFFFHPVAEEVYFGSKICTKTGMMWSEQVPRLIVLDGDD
jgi:hypothetical protein